MPKLSKEELKAIYRALSLITTMGVSIASCVGLGVFFGWLLDRWLGTSPWLILVFSLLGVAAAFKTMFELFKRINGDDVSPAKTDDDGTAQLSDDK